MTPIDILYIKVMIGGAIFGITCGIMQHVVNPERKLKKLLKKSRPYAATK